MVRGLVVEEVCIGERGGFGVCEVGLGCRAGAWDVGGGLGG